MVKNTEDSTDVDPDNNIKIEPDGDYVSITLPKKR